MAFIDSHLHRLVLVHDCLVVPGLGGFVCNRQPARFDEAANELVPPRRAIQFNERLLHNDGVLAHAVAVAEGMPYPEALQAVEQEAADLRQTLHHQRSITLSRVGRLFIGENGATQFLPEAELDRLLSGFGLQRIPLKPVARPTEEAPVLPIANPVRWPRIAAAIGIPLIAGGMWWMSASNEVDTLSLVPRLSEAPATTSYVPAPRTEVLPSLVESNGFSEVVGHEGEAVMRFDFEADRLSPDGVRIWVGNEPVAEEENASPALSWETSAFALVAGAFTQAANAQGHAADLAETGLQPEIHRIGTLHFVTVGLFTAEGDARAALSHVRGAGHEAVWMKRL